MRRRPRRTDARQHKRTIAAVSQLRRTYFANGAELAGRYRIEFPRVIQHIWQARRAGRRTSLRRIRYMDDLIHAIACVDESPQAWSDLTHRYERTLVRRCRNGLDEIEGTICARRLLAELRRRIGGSARDRLSLRCYTGNRPLGSWLAERLTAVRFGPEWCGFGEFAAASARGRAIPMSRAVGESPYSPPPTLRFPRS